MAEPMVTAMYDRAPPSSAGLRRELSGTQDWVISSHFSPPTRLHLLKFLPHVSQLVTAGDEVLKR